MLKATGGQMDDMLTRYRECSEANKESLKHARNIQDLVGIQVKSVDGAAV